MEQGNAAIGQADTDLQAKLVLLTLTFTRLRIIWSPSPYQTADIIQDLKAHQQEPDQEIAALAGVDERVVRDQGQSGRLAESQLNQSAVDLLRSLPAITVKNYRYIMSKVKNIEDLVNLSREEMDNLVGTEQGAKLHHFVNERIT